MVAPTLEDPPAALLESNGHSTQLSTFDRTAPRFNIGRDSLERAVSELPEDQRSALEKFWLYCNEHHVDRNKMRTLLKKPNGGFYSTDSIYQALTGRRTEAGANLATFCRSIEQFLRQVQPGTGPSKFIKTQLATAIWQYCDRVKELCAFGFIFGNMSIGKTDAAIEKKRNDPEALYTRTPTRGHLNHFLQEVAPALAMGDRQTVANLRRRVMEGLPKLWIIDEADQCFASIRNGWGLATLDFIREAWDYRRRIGKPIGIVLVMDHYGRDQLIAGKSSDRLKRLWRRRYRALQLPNTLSSRDLAKFAAAVDLPPAPNEEITVRAKVVTGEGEEQTKSFTENPATLQKDVVADHGLGIWKQILSDAKAIAKEQGRTIAWGAVIKAHAIFEAEEDFTEQQSANQEVGA